MIGGPWDLNKHLVVRALSFQYTFVWVQFQISVPYCGIYFIEDFFVQVFQFSPLIKNHHILMWFNLNRGFPTIIVLKLNKITHESYD